MHPSGYATRAALSRRVPTRRELSSRSRALLASPHRPLVVALLVAAAGAVAFTRVTEDYVTNDPLALWDVSLARWLVENRSSAGVDLFGVVSDVGSPIGCLVVAAIAAVVLARRRRFADAALLPVVFVGAQVLDLALKLTFHRARPELGVVHLDTYSYPSGHAMTATAVYGTLAYLLWRATTSRRALVLRSPSASSPSSRSLPRAASTSASTTSRTSSGASPRARRGPRSPSRSSSRRQLVERCADVCEVARAARAQGADDRVRLLRARQQRLPAGEVSGTTAIYRVGEA